MKMTKETIMNKLKMLVENLEGSSIKRSQGKIDY